MFNAVDVLGGAFKVVFQKQDGTLRELTGRLVAPNFEGSEDDLLAYCVSLVDKLVVPIYTEQGWRSFNASKVIRVELI